MLDSVELNGYYCLFKKKNAKKILKVKNSIEFIFLMVLFIFCLFDLILNVNKYLLVTFLYSKLLA